MRNANRVYDDYAQARGVVSNLEGIGIPASDISIIANRSADSRYDTNDADTASSTATGAEVGAAIGGGAGLLAALGVLALPGLGPVVAAGWLAATAVGAAGGAVAGGLLGALVDMGIPEEDAQAYVEAVRRGATMVSVRYPESRETEVLAILDRDSPLDISTRRASYEREGWTGTSTTSLGTGTSTTRATGSTIGTNRV